MKEPKDIAHDAIEKVMQEGGQKPRKQPWYEEAQDSHIDRAMKHISTHRLIRDGIYPPDGEKHLELAVARIAMALSLDGLVK